MQNSQSRIKELIQMKKDGDISQAEFDQMKAEALGIRQGNLAPKKPVNKATDLGMLTGMILTAAKESYRLIKPIGAGGMGQLWQVEDINSSKLLKENNYKAIKVLPLDLAGSAIHLDLLRKEAALTAELSHPNIINAYGLRESDQGIPFILMDYLQGQDLEHQLNQQGTMSWAHVQPYLQQIAEALDYAWDEHQLIHRDLKPGNIFITQKGRIKLLDFGLAWRIRKSQLSLSQQEVDDQSSRGTLCYMPPEAFANIAPHPKQDVYALACVCYQMFTGEPPYPPEAARLRDKTLFPASPEQLKPPAWDVLKQGLAYNKEQRPANAGVWVRQLQNAQNTVQKKADKKAQPAVKEPEPIKVSPPKTKPSSVIESGKQEPFRSKAVGIIVGLALLISGLIWLNQGVEQTYADSNQQPVQAASSPAATVTDPITGMQLLYIPPGSFMMGSPEDEPERVDDEHQHRVEITQGFYLGKYEVTQQQWKTVMGSNPSRFKGKHRPVEQVSWDDVQDFINKLNQQSSFTYRLPTEAEWEYAARAGTTTPFAFGDNITTDQANYDGHYPYHDASKGEYRKTTVKAGSFPANAWGLHDMHGNVWEWVSDWYAGDYYKTSPSQDPQGPSGGSGRVNRGGSWSNSARDTRSAYRYYTIPSNSSYVLGFRLARTKN